MIANFTFNLDGMIVMSAIRKGLESLDLAVSELEQAISIFEAKAPDLQQEDMFPETKQAIVKSLDNMITHVEGMIEKEN